MRGLAAAVRDLVGSVLIRAGWAVMTDARRDRISWRLAQHLTRRGWQPPGVAAAPANRDDG